MLGERLKYGFFSSHAAFLQVCVIKTKLMNETKFPADDGSGSQLCSFISSVLFYNKSDLDELCLLEFHHLFLSHK